MSRAQDAVNAWQREVSDAAREREERERVRRLAIARARGPYQRPVDADAYNVERPVLDAATTAHAWMRVDDRERRAQKAEARGETITVSSVLMAWGGCALCGTVVPHVLPSRRPVPHACLYIAGSDE